MNQTSENFENTPPRVRVERALQALRDGRGVLVTDNENRENAVDAERFYFGADSVIDTAGVLGTAEVAEVVGAGGGDVGDVEEVDLQALLGPFRGEPAVDRAAVAEVLLGLSAAAAEVVQAALVDAVTAAAPGHGLGTWTEILVDPAGRRSSP